MHAQQESLNIKTTKYSGNQVSLKNISKEVLSSTHQTVLNEYGSFFQFGLLLTLAFLCLSFFMLFKNFETLRLVRERRENYVCFKTLLKEASSFTKTMARTNAVIAVNYPLQFNPYTGAFHKQIVQTTKLIQEARAVYYRASIMKQSSCSMINRLNFLRLQFHKASPLGFGFSRSLIETTIPITNESWVYLWTSKRRFFSSEGDFLAISTKNPNSLTSPIFEVELKQIGPSL